MKPNTRTAMRQLIFQVRKSIPFDATEADLCADSCLGCSKKLLEYLALELENWDYRMKNGEIPNFGDINKLTKSSHKIFNTLKKNGVIR